MAASDHNSADLKTGRDINGDYRLIRRLGDGPSGIVFRAETIPSPFSPYIKRNEDAQATKPSEVDLEVIPGPSDVGEREEALAILGEVIHRTPDHVPILRAKEFGEDKKTRDLFLVMMTNRFDLRSSLANGAAFTDDEWTRLLHRVALALAWLHSKGFTHGRVSESTVFLADGSWWLAPPRVPQGTATAAQDIREFGGLLGRAAGPGPRGVPSRAAGEPDPRPTWLALANHCRSARPSLEEVLITLGGSAEPPEVSRVVRVGDNFEIELPAPPARPPAVEGELREVWLYRAAHTKRAASGAFLTTRSLDSLIGPTLGGHASEGPATVTVPIGAGLTDVVPVLIDGTAARVGVWTTLSPVPDVEGLKVEVDGLNLFLSWEWPANVDAVDLVYRTDRFASSPHDGERLAGIKRPNGERTKRFHLTTPPRVDHMFYVTVFARGKVRGQTLHASGQVEGARAALNLGKHRRLTYRIEPGNGGHSGQLLLRLWSDRPCELPELVLIGRAGDRVPWTRTQGREVAPPIAAGTECGPGGSLVVPFRASRETAGITGSFQLMMRPRAG